MPDFEVTSPEGKRFVVTAPDGATQDEIMKFAKEQAANVTTVPSNAAVVGNALVKGAAGLGDMFVNAPVNAYNLAQGAYAAGAEALGHPEKWADVNVVKEPNIVHSLFQKAGLIRPEAEPQTAGQRVIDSTTQGAVGMLAGPGGLARNAALGAVSGAAGQVTKEATGSDAAAITVSMLTPVATRHALVGMGRGATNEVLGQTLREGIDAGYVVPPTAIRRSFANNTLESFGGKAAVKQEAALRNQETTNRLAAQAIGLPPETTLTVGRLEQVREQAGQAYEAVAQLPQLPGVYGANLPTPAIALQQLREARHEANLNYQHYERTADPNAQRLADAARDRAERLETILEQAATRSGRPELVDQLRDARQLIARTYDVERALNVGDGNVSARIIGRALDRGKPLTGELAVIGRFAQAFPAVTREGASVPTPGVSALNPVASAGLGMAGYATGGTTTAILAAGAPLLRGPARSLSLSGYKQNALINPPLLEDTFTKSVLAGRSLTDSLGDRK